MTIDLVLLAGIPVLRIESRAGLEMVSGDPAPEVGGLDHCQAVHVGVMMAGEMAVEEADGAATMSCAPAIRWR